MVFVKFVEKNDYEGESWAFFLPLDGNEDAIAELDGLITAQELDDTYGFEEEEYEEDEVDLLVDEAEDGYLPSHNKLYGQLTVEGLESEEVELAEVLYKGGIRDLLVQE